MRILLIDDHPAVQRVMADALEGEGHEVFLAGTGEEGLQIVEGSEPDAVFLDLLLPGIDGIEVLRRLRATRPQLPVIVLSGSVTPERLAAARALGVTDVVRKPAPLKHFGEILARVQPA